MSNSFLDSSWESVGAKPVATSTAAPTSAFRMPVRRPSVDRPSVRSPARMDVMFMMQLPDGALGLQKLSLRPMLMEYSMPREKAVLVTSGPVYGEL